MGQINMLVNVGQQRTVPSADKLANAQNIQNTAIMYLFDKIFRLITGTAFDTDCICQIFFLIVLHC